MYNCKSEQKSKSNCLLKWLTYICMLKIYILMDQLIPPARDVLRHIVWFNNGKIWWSNYVILQKRSGMLSFMTAKDKVDSKLPLTKLRIRRCRIYMWNVTSSPSCGSFDYCLHAYVRHSCWGHGGKISSKQAAKYG